MAKTSCSKTTQRCGIGRKKVALPGKKAAVTQSVATSPKCAICCDPVVDGEGDALQCDRCDLWAHRYCSGMSVAEFQTLNGTPTPYFCLFCLKKVHEETVTELQQAVAELRTEVAQLKTTLQDVRRSNEQLVKRIESEAAPSHQIKPLAKANKEEGRIRRLPKEMYEDLEVLQ